VGIFAVIGDGARVEGFALGGAMVFPAATPSDVRRARAELPSDVVVVLLTLEAAAALCDEVRPNDHVLSVVMPS
jgi:vacuolar-type H+-ATPase subunit F/Vma7